MNNQIKILLNIQGIEGRTLHFLGKKKVKWSITKRDIYHEYKGKDADKEVRKGYFYMKDVEQIPCQQTIKLTQDAYDYMTSSERPEWYKGFWNKLNRRQKLEVHLQRICGDRHGSKFSYSILED